MNGLPIFWMIMIFFTALLLGGAFGYMYKQNLVDKIQREQKDEAGRVLEAAKEQARLLEIQARDEAIEIRKVAEEEIERARLARRNAEESAHASLPSRGGGASVRAPCQRQQHGHFGEAKNAMDERTVGPDEETTERVFRLGHYLAAN
mgnify:CR=1 FL=1